MAGTTVENQGGLLVEHEIMLIRRGLLWGLGSFIVGTFLFSFVLLSFLQLPLAAAQWWGWVIALFVAFISAGVFGVYHLIPPYIRYKYFKAQGEEMFP